MRTVLFCDFKNSEQKSLDPESHHGSQALFKIVSKNKYGVKSKLVKLTNSETSVNIYRDFFSKGKVNFNEKDYVLGKIIGPTAEDPQLYMNSQEKDIVLKRCTACNKSYLKLSDRFPYKYTCVYCKTQTESNLYKKPDSYGNLLLFL